VIRLQPPLIVSEAEIKHFVGALDHLLGRGVVSIVRGYIKAFVQAA
jgi:acetylornithine/succinyldiaminopimelate/putrescine aminotransferase